MTQAQQDKEKAKRLMEIQASSGYGDRQNAERQTLARELSALSATRDQLRAEINELTSGLHAVGAILDNSGDTWNVLMACCGKPLPVFLGSDLRPLANLRSGATKEKVLICSIPKAGTYLYARLLQLLGLESSGLHFNMTYLNDLRFTLSDQISSFTADTKVDIPIKESIKLVKSGQFSVSHLEKSKETGRLLKDFKIIFIFREMRDATVSDMRFVSKINWQHEDLKGPISWYDEKDSAKKMVKYFKDMAPFYFYQRCHPMVKWTEQAGVLKLSFEQIMGDFGRDKQLEAIQEVREFCGIENNSIDPEQVLQQLIGKQTETYSGRRTRWHEYWSEEVENLFTEFGGREINKRFGFER